MSDECQSFDKSVNDVSEVVVAPSCSSGAKRSNEEKEKKEEEPPDVAKKRPRGPSDCLNWSDSEEDEFVPYTQSNPEVVYTPPKKKVFAKKSVVKRSRGKAGCGKMAVSKSAGSKDVSKVKGKYPG